MSKRRSLLALLPAAAVAAVAAGGAATTGYLPHVIPAAHAQSNPCGIANPCGVANPCAVANPCGVAADAGDKGETDAPKYSPTAETPADNPFDVPAGYTQAAYGDTMPDVVENYLRAAPYVGTGGVVADGGYAMVKAVGFKTVLSLNTAEEGVADEREQAEAAGLTYLNVPVSEEAPVADQVARIAEIVNDPANYPILMNCQSSNRVGAAWALYRADAGVPEKIAVQEGRTVGLAPSREWKVREILGMDPLPEQQ
ncbi:fused DSP-PTPase phosphatase/NAD kinase-like protein [Paracoccus salsus]|uniref:fused DSP-PTPase phosphatase/NAD kinase-like protein n=1 Tax=Paracoccus salsus TaxID=2911061 RepID=UPI001F430F2E|nr:sulfur transferase domain-containing protein [Paracoccus salsus]MCF3972613.1 sulfur transferase domain-containing protein [Paracoccus salsus]